MEAHGELRKDVFSEEKAFQEAGGHQPSPSRRHGKRNVKVTLTGTSVVQWIQAKGKRGDGVDSRGNSLRSLS